MMRVRLALLMPILIAGGLLAGAAAGPSILAFNRIQPGSWQLRALDSSLPAQRLCIADAYDLIQLRHPGAVCSRFVLTNDAETATVHYTCMGGGYGRTTIKVETGQLIRVESQGIANQSPFEMALEGRRTGACSAQHAAR